MLIEGRPGFDTHAAAADGDFVTGNIASVHIEGRSGFDTHAAATQSGIVTVFACVILPLVLFGSQSVKVKVTLA